MAVDLTARGFSVNMFEMPEFADGMRQVFQTRTIHSSGMINGSFRLNNVVNERDWWVDGRTQDDLGLAGLSPDEIKSYVRTGKRR
jgi:opine dehydrogenase